MSRRASPEVLYLSRNGNELFLMKKENNKWYLLGQSVDNSHQWPIMFSTNKKRLLKFVKTLGFVKI